MTVIPLGTEVEIVAPITNRTKSKLDDVYVYLEHLGGSDAQFTPLTWNVGSLAPGDLFLAVWPLSTTGWMSGRFYASIVVGSARNESVRLRAPIEIGRGTRK